MEIWQNIHFLRPYWFLALLPIAIIVWFLLRRHLTSRSWKAVCDARLLPYILRGAEGQRMTWPIYALAVAAVLLVTAMAGPAWEELPQPVYRTQSALVIVLDMSYSMDATDVKPSRIARARHKITDILQKRKEGQTGLVVFAMEPFVVSPLTDDAKTIIALVASLKTELMPNQGSRTVDGVKKAVELLQQASMKDGNILLVTDGVREQDIDSIAEQVQSKGHRLSVLAVGTAEGAPIKLSNGALLKNASGTIVIPKLQEQPLRQLAAQSGGRYANLVASDKDIDYLLRGFSVSPLDASMNSESSKLTIKADSWREEGPWLLLLAIPLAAMAFRRGWLTVLLLVLMLPLPTPSYAFNWADLWKNDNQKASEAFQRGDHEQATQLFKEKEWQAAAHYKAQNYDKALTLLENSASADGLYNKGNALARLGRIEEAIDAYEEALKMAPDHEDAEYNKEQLEKFQQQQQSQEQNKNNNQDDKQNQQSQNQQQQSSGEQNQTNQQNQSQSGAQPEDGDQQQGKQTDSNDLEQNAQNRDSADASDSQNEQRQKQASAPRRQGDESEQQQALDDKESQDDSDRQNEQTQISQANNDSKQLSEAQRATEQWLRRIPDDPGGLLRRKFLYQSQVNPQQSVQGDQPW